MHVMEAWPSSQGCKTKNTSSSSAPKGLHSLSIKFYYLLNMSQDRPEDTEQ